MGLILHTGYQPPWQPTGPRIAFVGDFPDEEDLLEGLPFTAGPGRVMGQILRTAGMTRTDEMPDRFYPAMSARGLRPLLWERSNFLWTNVFNSRPTEGEIKSWCAPAPEAKEWQDYEMDRIDGAGYLRPEFTHHLERLAAELSAYGPTLVVPLGALALWALTGSSNIDDSRGAVAKASLLIPGTKLLPTHHPRRVIASYKMFSVVVTDLTKAQREAAFPEIRLPRREIWIEPTIEDLYAFKEKHIPQGSLLSTDIETAGGQITCIGFAPNSTQALVIPFVDYRKSNRSYWPSEDSELSAWAFVAELLEDTNIFKLMQNGSYDVYWLWRYARIKVNGYLHDTRLQHHALYAELPKSLAFMGASYGNQGAWKIMRERKSDKRDE